MGMGIEVPTWVITTSANKKFFNHTIGKFDKEVSKECLFSSPNQANEKLRELDFGYVVKGGRHYMDVHENRIRINF